jgi:hypothetical protein
MKPEQFNKLPKWAQTEFSDLKSDYMIAKAFRFTDDVKRDLEPPSEWNNLIKGWNFNSYFDRPSVFKACSSGGFNGDGWEKTSSQGARSLFSTELLAWKALRRELELTMAKKLAWVDEQIERANDAMLANEKGK